MSTKTLIISDCFLVSFTEHLLEIAQSTGVVLDPNYTLKAARGMLLEMEKNPSRFKGKRVLFLHTGAINYLYTSFSSLIFLFDVFFIIS